MALGPVDEVSEGGSQGVAEGADEGCGGQERTMLTILEGTTITLRMVLPSSQRAAAGSARAAFSTSAAGVPAATWMV